METNNQEFSFTYSAKEQEEVKRIRQKYEPKEDNKMEQLRKLDAGVTKKATTVSLSIGIIGALILGSGMSLAMTDLGSVLGFAGIAAMIAGVVIGIAGIALVCIAYPVYKRITKKERERIAPIIINLADELMK